MIALPKPEYLTARQLAVLSDTLFLAHRYVDELRFARHARERGAVDAAERREATARRLYAHMPRSLQREVGTPPGDEKE